MTEFNVSCFFLGKLEGVMIFISGLTSGTISDFPRGEPTYIFGGLLPRC